MRKKLPDGIKFLKDGGVIINPHAVTAKKTGDAKDATDSSIRIPQADTALGAGFGDVITNIDREFASEREPVAHFLTYLMSRDVFDKWFVVDDPSTEGGDPKINETVQNALTLLKTKRQFTELLVYERIYGWSLLVGSFTDAKDIRDLDMPLQKGSGLVQIAAYPRTKVDDKWLIDTNENSPRFGETIIYKIDRGQGAFLYIHYSRCHKLQTRVSKEGVLDPIWDDLTCGRNIRWGASQWMYRNGSGFPVIKFPKNTSQEKLEEWMDSDAFSNIMNRTYIGITADMDFEFKGAMGRALDPTPFFHTNLEEIAKGTGVPEPVLRGAQAGAVTGSEVNLRQYFKVISGIQTSLDELVRWVIDHLTEGRQIKGLPYAAEETDLLKRIKRWVAQDVQPQVQPLKFEINWTSAFEMNELDEKNAALLHEQANQIRLQYMTVNEVRKMNELEELKTDPTANMLRSFQPFQTPNKGDTYVVTHHRSSKSSANRTKKPDKKRQQNTHIH